MGLLVVYLLILGALGANSSENRSAFSYNLCDIGPALTSQHGRIYATCGMHCSRLILAPEGYRIKVNITVNTLIFEEEPMYVYDGATSFDNKNRAKITRHRVTDHYIAISTSNAVLIYVDKISSKATNVEITYNMFPHPPDRCQCLPVTNGETICSFPSQYFREDTLTKYCTVACGQNRFIANRFYSNDFEMQCFMGDPKRDLVYKGKWHTRVQHEILHDNQLITCARIFPATRLKIGYKFNYANVSCAQINETEFVHKIRQYISGVESIANVSQCFKHRNLQRTINCSVESLNISCKSNGNRRTAELILTVRDNIINSTNETVAFQRYHRLYSAYYEDNQNLQGFITKNLTVSGIKHTGISYVYWRSPTEDCPANAASKIDYVSSKFGCLNCPPNFYTQPQERNILPCHECQNGTRRNEDEVACIPGPRNYPNPSQKYCKHTCNLGKYFNFNSSLCEWCPYGTYQNSTTLLNPECTPCPGGLTTGFTGARNISECIKLCPAGYYLKYTQCVQCDVGYYMPNASNRFPKCYKCESDYTTLNKSAVECVKKCNSGEYFNMTLRNCAPCPNDTYQDEIIVANARHCKNCPANTTTTGTGSSLSSDCLGPCSFGHYIDIGLKKCSPCPLDTYQDERQHTSFSCKICDKYKITLQVASSNVSECIYECSEGKFFNITSKLCEECPINMYQGEFGKETCKLCEGKTFTIKIGSKICINPCNYGEFLNKTVENCQNCSRGFYQNISGHTSVMCKRCPMDFFSEISGQKDCTACKDGGITLISGATKETECIETCKPGYFLEKTTRRCEKCSKGFYQDKKGYRDDFCTKCGSANVTTLGTGAKSVEECVGFCASFPCLNGGECFNIDNDFNCSCPKFLIGKQCERISDRPDSDSMEISIRFPVLTWNESLKNSASIEFKHFSLRIENAIRAELVNDTTFRSVNVVDFHPGSVISDVEFTYVGGVSFSNPADTLTTAVADGTLDDLIVDTSSMNITNFTCSQPLGMVNGRIPDSAITSGVKRSYLPPKNARLHNPGPGWAPQYLSGDDVYLQVDFLEEIWLTGIATQGSSYHGGSWLQTFYLRTSSDGRNWVYYVGEYVTRHLFIANDNVDTVVRNTLPYPVKTRYVRMFEYHFKEWISYRVEFYGCPIPKTIPLPTFAVSRSSVPTSRHTPTSTHSSTAVSVDDDNEDDDDNVGLIVGVVLGVLMFCIILVFAVVWWIKRKRSAFLGSSVSVMELKETN
ncbi:uncharacterized protein LOC114530191 [Dendronephthya gigantea]|uniref:uncharacterized protein LOC114530191 n=1 Tax=Dendronephthya gigantea TaxID=151771 RepID=UPI00106933BC|nr:uncharacterized protein LOC114530191 [Dendronephthya gigantea]XP_028407567.1 uncharacterized protein LOC114530191 [Dendronephthya gigantea]XP_028407568.1 uncharacterized protein LOC114530191 [Dendronephthya gigantea]